MRKLSEEVASGQCQCQLDVNNNYVSEFKIRANSRPEIPLALTLTTTSLASVTKLSVPVGC
jgi:hypothetical protein